MQEKQIEKLSRLRKKLKVIEFFLEKLYNILLKRPDQDIPWRWMEQSLISVATARMWMGKMKILFGSKSPYAELDGKRHTAADVSGSDDIISEEDIEAFKADILDFELKTMVGQLDIFRENIQKIIDDETFKPSLGLHYWALWMRLTEARMFMGCQIKDIAENTTIRTPGPKE